MRVCYSILLHSTSGLQASIGIRHLSLKLQYKKRMLMSKISLTASMRANLLNLQKASGNLQKASGNFDVTQNRLSTGQKINSAIENPINFYTAVSLNNRAKDLNTLLDAMGQGISIIKTALHGIKNAINILQQAKSVIEQATNDSGKSLSVMVTKYGIKDIS